MRIDPLPIGLVLVVVLQLLIGPAVAFADAVRVGSPAPEFAFVGTDGLAYHSSDYFRSASSANAGEVGMKATGQAREGEPGRGVVIAWFPKAFTSG